MPRFSKSELIKLQKKLKTDAEIGKKFGITRQAVHTMRKFYGILPIPGARTVFPPPRISKPDLIKLQTLLITDGAIGGKLGLSTAAVQKIRKKYGVPAKLIDNATRNNGIVSLYKKGMPGTAVAKQVSLSIPMVYKILRKAGMGRNKLARKREPNKTSARKKGK